MAQDQNRGLQQIKNPFGSLVLNPLLLITILTLCSISSPVKAQNFSFLPEKEKILTFADYLFETEEYYRAITEYTRFLFFFPDGPLVKVIRLKIAYAYQKGDQWLDALRLFEALWQDYADQEIGREACFQSAETLRLQKNYQSAIKRYRLFIENFPEDERVNTAFFHIGCIQLELHEWMEAAGAFKKVKPNNQFSFEAGYLTKEAKKLPHLPLKKPALAGILSATIPGSGQMYAHRYRDGLTAFLVNGGFIWGIAEAFHEDQSSLGTILLFIELGWYAGNIYSAVNSTKKFNLQKIEKKLTPLLERCRLSFNMKQPMKRSRGIKLSFLFY